MKKKIAMVVGCLLIFGLNQCSKDDGPAEVEEVQIDRSANLLSAGESAADIITNETFDRLEIEIAYVEGFRPTDETIENLRSFLAARTFKTDISFAFLSLPSPDEESLTLEEIAVLENENRTRFNDGSTLALYIYFADAPAESDDEEEGTVTLGAVYRNTSMVIHEITLRRLAGRSLIITRTDVESATLMHEFGHLFGLVDLGTPEVNPHEDPEAVHHCNVEGCLMQASLEFSASARKVLESRAAKGSSVVPSLDAECIRDLQGIGGR